jgi:hypothetical protein
MPGALIGAAGQHVALNGQRTALLRGSVTELGLGGRFEKHLDETRRRIR